MCVFTIYWLETVKFYLNFTIIYCTFFQNNVNFIVLLADWLPAFLPSNFRHFFNSVATELILSG